MLHWAAPSSCASHKTPRPHAALGRHAFDMRLAQYVICLPLHTAGLAPQHQQPNRRHLLGHPEGSVEPCADAEDRHAEPAGAARMSGTRGPAGELVGGHRRTRRRVGGRHPVRYTGMRVGKRQTSSTVRTPSPAQLGGMDMRMPRPMPLADEVSLQCLCLSNVM